MVGSHRQMQVQRWRRTLRAAGRILGPALIALAVALELWSPFLLRLLPFREIVLAILLAGILATAWTAYRSPTTWTRWGLAGLALVAVGLGAYLYQREFRAYQERVLRFDSAGARLVGTLYVPHGPGPFPGMVVVHGSGALPRRVYRVVGDHFARQGFATLVYDKRGVGASSGEYEGRNNSSERNLELLADDAAAALVALSRQAEVRSDQVGFWGVSQAGWIVPRAAVKSRLASFMVLVSGPTVSVGEEGAYSELSGDYEVNTGLSVEEAERRLEGITPSGFDPLPDLLALDVPGLWLQGGQDRSIPAHRSIRILQRLIDDGKPYAFQLFPDAGHAILLPRAGLRLPEPAPGFWEAMDGWLERTLGER